MIRTISLTDCLASATLAPVASSSTDREGFAIPLTSRLAAQAPKFQHCYFEIKKASAAAPFFIAEDKTDDHQRQSPQPGASLEDRAALGRHHSPLLSEGRRTIARLRPHRAHSRAHGRRTPVAIAPG